MSKGGRPRKEIDWRMVDALCRIQCTGEEIASMMGVDYDTLVNACKREHKRGFSDYMTEKRAGGKASLRRMQWKAAEAGNPTMLIWLGKQMLQQKDRQEVAMDAVHKVESITYTVIDPKSDDA